MENTYEARGIAYAMHSDLFESRRIIYSVLVNVGLRT